MPVVAGAGGQPKVVLSTADATAEVYLHGATLTSWKVGGEELIFVSPKAVFEPPKAIRGGVPVCFPQFGMLGPLKVRGAAGDWGLCACMQCSMTVPPQRPASGAGDGATVLPTLPARAGCPWFPSASGPCHLQTLSPPARRHSMASRATCPGR